MRRPYKPCKSNMALSGNEIKTATDLLISVFATAIEDMLTEFLDPTGEDLSLVMTQRLSTMAELIKEAYREMEATFQSSLFLRMDDEKLHITRLTPEAMCGLADQNNWLFEGTLTSALRAFAETHFEATGLDIDRIVGNESVKNCIDIAVEKVRTKATTLLAELLAVLLSDIHSNIYVESDETLLDIARDRFYTIKELSIERRLTDEATFSGSLFSGLYEAHTTIIADDMCSLLHPQTWQANDALTHAVNKFTQKYFCFDGITYDAIMAHPGIQTVILDARKITTIAAGIGAAIHDLSDYIIVPHPEESPAEILAQHLSCIAGALRELEFGWDKPPPDSHFKPIREYSNAEPCGLDSLSTWLSADTLTTAVCAFVARYFGSQGYDVDAIMAHDVIAQFIQSAVTEVTNKQRSSMTTPAMAAIASSASPPPETMTYPP